MTQQRPTQRQASYTPHDSTQTIFLLFTACCTGTRMQLVACFPLQPKLHILSVWGITALPTLDACRHIQPETRAAPSVVARWLRDAMTSSSAPIYRAAHHDCWTINKAERKPATSTRRHLRDACLARHGILTQHGNATCQRYFVAPGDSKLPSCLLLRNVLSLFPIVDETWLVWGACSSG
ncbi:hypothetical protein V8C26DRAFT_310916 [Trichoderma gracile]